MPAAILQNESYCYNMYNGMERTSKESLERLPTAAIETRKRPVAGRVGGVQGGCAASSWIFESL